MANVAVVTDAGMGIISNRIKGSGTEPVHIGWGTGATAAAAGNTGLETPAAEARTSGTSSRQQTNVANDTYQVVGVVTCAGSAKAITEVVLMDAATDGVNFMRATFGAVNLSIGEGIEFTIKTVFDQAA